MRAMGVRQLEVSVYMPVASGAVGDMKLLALQIRNVTHPIINYTTGPFLEVGLW